MRKFTKMLQLITVVFIATSIVFSYANAQSNPFSQAKTQVDQVQLFTGTSADLAPVYKTVEKKVEQPAYLGTAGLIAEKPNAVYRYNANDWPTPKQGGEDIATATVIAGLPYQDFGTTTGYIDDYDETCPYSGSTAPDVVYAFSPGSDIFIDIDLCGEGTEYDTKVFVYEDAATPGAPYACNDDACSNSWTTYASQLVDLQVFSGHTYYIVVDGYGGSFGNYELNVSEYTPCVVECPPGSIDEGEGVVPDEYDDMLNGGCNSAPPVFMNIDDGDTYCGIINTFLYGGSNYRDTDWYRFDATSFTDPFTLTWEGAATCPFIMFVIQANSEDCADYVILGNVSGDCDPITQSYVVNPGVYWVLMMPSVFDGYPTQQDYWATLTTDAGPPPLDNDNCADATAINEVTDLPYSTTLATYDGPGACMSSPNIWYDYTPTQTGDVIISLCGSSYDTYLGVYSGFDCATMTNIICNDDACGLQSEVTIPVTMGEEIKIEVGGYSTNVGDGILNIYFGVPCVVECPPGSIMDDEPVVYDEYEDTYNGGCNSIPPVFGNVSCGTTICGSTGYYMYGGSQYRDTDWFIMDLAGETEVTATFECETPSYMFFILDPAGDCATTTIEYQLLVSDCEIGTLTATLDPALGSWYLWVGPDFSTTTDGPDNTYYVTFDCVTFASLDGTLTYFNNGTPMDFVTVDAGAASGMTDATGYYGPYSLPDGPVVLDVMHSKPWATFNVIDVVIFRQFLATGVPALLPIQLMAADVFWQGGTAPNVLDAVVMRQQLANLNPVNYTADDWLYYDVNATVMGVTTHDFEAVMSGDVNGSNIPDPYVPPVGQWIQWDGGVNDDAIGLTSGGTFWVASYWDPAALAPYDGQDITKIEFFAGDYPGATYVMKIWTGPNGGLTEVYSGALGGYTQNAYNEHVLTTPFTIDASQELWFGYEVTHPAGEYPAGCEAGATFYYGDMITLDFVTFVSMGSDYGLDYDWNLHAWVE